MKNIENEELCNLLEKIKRIVDRSDVPLLQRIEQDHPYTIGKPWFFRTVTHHLTGIVEWVGEHEILLKGGTVRWIASDGRFSDAISTLTFSETEIYGQQSVVVGRGSIIDATELSNCPNPVKK